MFTHYYSANPDYALTDKEYFEVLKKRCSETTLYGGVKILIDLPFQEMLKQFGEHDIFVLPSIAESFATSVLEALASGCAVIASNDNGSSGYIEDGINGLTFKKNNIEDLIAKLNFFIKDSGKIAIFGYRAIEKVKQEHNPAKFVKQIEQLYFN